MNLYVTQYRDLYVIYTGWLVKYKTKTTGPNQMKIGTLIHGNILKIKVENHPAII